MRLEPEVVWKGSDAELLYVGIRIPACQYFLALMVEGGLEGVNFALNRLFHCKYLMVLLYAELGDDFSEIGNSDGAVIRSHSADEMMVMLGACSQCASLLHVGIDDQFEVDRSDPSEGSSGIVVQNAHEAFVAHGGVLVGTDVEPAYDTSIFYDQHHWMDG